MLIGAMKDCHSGIIWVNFLLRYICFQNLPRKVKVMGRVAQGNHPVDRYLLFHTNQSIHSWNTFPKFDLENPQIQCQVMVEVKVPGCIMCSTLFTTHPFHSLPIGPPIPEIWLFENLTLKIKVKVMGRSKFKFTKWVWFPMNSHPFLSMLVAPMGPYILEKSLLLIVGP